MLSASLELWYRRLWTAHHGGWEVNLGSVGEQNYLSIPMQCYYLKNGKVSRNWEEKDVRNYLGEQNTLHGLKKRDITCWHMSLSALLGRVEYRGQMSSTQLMSLNAWQHDLETLIVKCQTASGIHGFIITSLSRFLL